MLDVIIGIFVILAIILWLDCRKPKNFPPGPRWYPVVGSAFAISNARNKAGMLIKGIDLLAEQHPEAKESGILGVKVGKDQVVMTIGEKAINEFMTNELIDGRPTGPFYETRTWGLRRGIIMVDEEFWQVQRRFIARHLKDFGFARNGMTEIIENEIEFCINDILKETELHDGKFAMIKMQKYFSVYILNTLWQMMAGIRYTREHKELERLQSLLHELFLRIDMMGALFSHFPYLRFIAPGLSGYNDFVDIHNAIHEFTREEVERHKKTLDYNDEPRDLIDVYLKIIESMKNNNTCDKDQFPFPPNFTEEEISQQLLAVLLDLFMAGSETTTKTLNYGILCLVRNQDVQKKMQKEIDDVIGRERIPTMNDKPKLPYCEAVILETMRSFMANTFGIPHRALKDTTICGYFIPKDTMVLSSFRGMMLDEKLWSDPNEFRPERFIKNGKLNVPPQFHPFGAGKRRCMGELMGKSNVFCFITTLFQKFEFKVPPGHPIPTDETEDGATPSIKEYTAMLVPRF